MKLELIGIEGIPMIMPGDDLVAIIPAALAGMGLRLEQDDVLVLAQKIVSKSENRYVLLDEVTPGAAAVELAKEVDKDPRMVEAILRETRAIVRKRPGVLIVENRHGIVHANAGIDQSNIDHAEGGEKLLLLPTDPDASARRIREEIRQRFGVDVAVIINDSVGRAWRIGTLGLAIGVAGMTALEDYIGKTDIFGREMKVTQVAAADELAAGASLVMGQTDQKVPAVLVRGYRPREPEDPALRGVGPLIRPREMDMFR